ncbi:MAG: hypothetical protein NTY77_01310 [Elusimicrobia bacterium]|nr:hypothetical protein [Elusimicrobiota bacterium]
MELSGGPAGSKLSDRPYRLILLLAALFYATQLGRSYVGVLIDDASYIAGARSLLQGRYVDLTRPDTPPLIHFLPGFPLFLSPWVGCVAPHWQLLQGLAVALILVAAILLHRWLAGRLSGRERGLAVLLFALNPATARLCSLVTAESWFLVLWLWILPRLDGLLKEDRPAAAAWPPALLLGWAALTRPEGIVLTAVLGMLAFRADLRRRLWPIVAGACAIWGAWLLRNYALSHQVSDYLGEWRADLGAAQLWRGWWAVLDTLFVQAAGLLPPGFAPGPSRALALLGSMALALLGLRELLRRNPDPGTRSAAAAWGLYLAVHLLWRPLDVRYFLPLMPLLAVFMVLGLLALLGRGGKSRLLGWSAAVLLAATYAAQDARLAADGLMRRPYGNAQNPTATWKSVQSLLGEGSALLSNNAPTVYIYTGRQAYSLPVGIRDADELRYLLAQKDIRAVLLFFPLTDIAPAHQESWLRVWDWIRSAPRRYELLHAEPQEGSLLYRVAGSGVSVRAYELYVGARGDFSRERWRDGFAKLDLALALEPDFPSAVKDRAVAASLAGRSR